MYFSKNSSTSALEWKGSPPNLPFGTEGERVSNNLIFASKDAMSPAHWPPAPKFRNCRTTSFTSLSCSSRVWTDACVLRSSIILSLSFSFSELRFLTRSARPARAESMSPRAHSV